jgi:hypothetical protein
MDKIKLTSTVKKLMIPKVSLGDSMIDSCETNKKYSNFFYHVLKFSYLNLKFSLFILSYVITYT